MPAYPFRPPATLTLAVDARLQRALPAEEHVWTLRAAHAHSGALALTTTYGLRVQEMVVFPLVAMDEQVRWKAEAFAGAPQVMALDAAYARLTCHPFVGLALTCEYWVPLPRVVVGRIGLRNTSSARMAGVLGLAAILRPLEEGGGMMTVKRGAVHVLEGKGGGLHPVLFLTGGAEGVLSPFPALQVPFDLPEGASRRLTWVHTALDDADAGFELARQLAARKWGAFFARLALLEQQALALEEEDDQQRSWVFARACQTAHRLVQHLPEVAAPFVVTARDADHSGFGDPAAQNRAASVLDAYYLATGWFLPTQSAVVQGWVRAFLDRQEEDGSIPWRLVGDGRGYLASPLLVELAYRAYQHTPQALGQLYAPLRRFIEAWYARGDANRDGFPEWAHPLQMGLADLPGFSPWRRESPGGELSLAESPALYALLYRALTRLEMLAEAAGEKPPPDLRPRQRRLRAAVQAMWDARRRAPLYRDRDTHERPPYRVLGKRYGSGPLAVGETFAVPVRLIVHLFPQRGEVRPAAITVQGSDERGKPLSETLQGGRIRWHEGRGVAVTRCVFRHVAEVAVTGLRSRGRFVVLTPDYTLADISLLLPFWADMLDEGPRAAVLRALTSERAYGRPYGMPLAPRGGQRAPDWQRAVWMPWNAFMVEALLEQGERDAAARLLENLASAASGVLQAQGVFREAYHADRGDGLGGKDVLSGLLPVGLWLRAAGLQPLSPRRVRFLWPTPFSRELVARFWGWQIRRKPGRTLVTTPDGVTHTMTLPEPYEVAW